MTASGGAVLAPGDVLELSVGEAVHGGWCVGRTDEAAADAEPGSKGAGAAGHGTGRGSHGGAGQGSHGAEWGSHGTGRDRHACAAQGSNGAGHGSHGAGIVVFVRHALPGERVRAVITQVTARFARADATQVLVAAPERVPPPCPYARPGGCGGCDWQHASLPAQRGLKAGVIAQQLRRLAGIERDVVVEPVAGDSEGLGWRTRVRFAVRPDGTAGLRKHRSHQIVGITDCMIAHPLVRQLEITRRQWPGARSVDVAVAPETAGRWVAVGAGRSDRTPGDRVPATGTERGPADGAAGAALRQRPEFLAHRAAGRDWRVTPGGFWQVHPGAADALAAAVLEALAPQPGEHGVDIFCGSGLFAGVLADAVGAAGSVMAVERDAAAAGDARHNLRGTPWATVEQGDAVQVLRRTGLAGADIAVADPPRTGLEAELIGLLCSAGLRRVAYVSCDPATLARDVAVFGREGWALAGLRAFDAFPMTHHVECVATLAPADAQGPADGRR